MAKKRTSRWASEASQQALLRFGPQIDALNQIQSEAEAAYKTSSAQARGNADATIATVDQARPQVAGIYDQAGLDQARSAQTVNANVAGLPGLSDNLRAAISLEQANAGSRVSSGRAQALTGLAEQRVAARAGGQYAQNKARDDLMGQLQKIFAQRQSLAGQSGTFQALTQSQLQDASRQRALKVALNNADNTQSERNSLRSAGIDPQTGQPIPGGKLDPKKQHGKVSASGVKLNPAGAHATARQAVQKAISTLGTLDPDRTDRHHTAPALVAGAPAVKGEPVYTKDSTGKQTRALDPDNTPKTTGDLPAIPAVGEWATIAADVYYDGHLSRANQRKLADQGYSIRQLGLPTYAQWKRTHSPAAERRKAAARRAGTAAGNMARGVF